MALLSPSIEETFPLVLTCTSPPFLQVRKTLYDNADEETPYGQTVAQVADQISQLRGNLTIQVDPATAPQGEDQGITVNDVSASTMLWLPCTGCLTKEKKPLSWLVLCLPVLSFITDPLLVCPAADQHRSC